MGTGGAAPRTTMNKPANLDELTDEIREVAFQVNAASERSDERDFIAATHLAVERISSRYRAYCADLSEMERMQVDRKIGRRLSDIKRLAALLPRIGTIPVSTPDRRVEGASEVGERRITGVSWGAGARAHQDGSSGYRVGGDVEAWCGPCGGLTEHSIVAMVGNDPKQVVCQACNARHGYRTSPARKSGRSSEAEIRPTAGDREAQIKLERKEEEKRALAEEIAQAGQVREFDPKGRYKTGEIIWHPDYGRGKVETVLRSSMLVRFGVGGLKSVMLV